MMLIINDFDVTFLLQCLIGWLSLYYLLFKIFPTSQHSEWNCRIVTVLHAIVISVLAGYCCFVQGPWPLTDAGGPNTPLQVITASICLAYFIFDFSWCLYYGTEGVTMLFHHFMSIVGLTVTLLTGRYGTELVATICGGEITNPLLQLRWFLRTMGYKDTKAAIVVDMMFVCSFGFVRLGIGSVLLYCYFTQPTDYLGRFGAVCIYSMGVIFWINIMQYAMTKLGKISSSKNSRNAQGKENESVLKSNGVQKLSKEHLANGCVHLNGFHKVDNMAGVKLRHNGVVSHVSS